MNRIIQLLFPALMLVGMFVSAIVIATSLQATSFSGASPTQTQTASSTDSDELVAQGRALFVAKGCLVCHRYDEMAATRREMGDFDFDDVPNLSHLKIDAAYLKRWLHDPRAIKPATTMPNLNLSESELDALVAFLTASK